MQRDILCFGHRGAAGHAPENTLASVQKALELGVDWIEIDVYAVEGELVVLHDDRLERTTNGTGYVMEQSLHYLRSLDAGGGEKIPFLREVFEVIDRQVGLNIELKGTGTALPVNQTIDHFVKQRGWAYEQILVSSFNHHELQRVKTLEPRLRTGALIAALPLHYAAFAQELEAYAVHPSMEFLDEAFVADAHRRGLKVFAFTANNLADLERLRSLTVDGAFSDYPDIWEQLS